MLETACIVTTKFQALYSWIAHVRCIKKALCNSRVLSMHGENTDQGLRTVTGFDVMGSL